MEFDEYYKTLPIKRSLSEVKQKIIKRLWGENNDKFPKKWVSSKELLELTEQKYFDRRTRELRDELGCHLESKYNKDLADHAWRITSTKLEAPQDREYLTEKQKKALFESCDYTCATCGVTVQPGIRGLQADHKVPVSRGGTNILTNWQALCVSCNVGKRRACDSCDLDCKSCVWAFPDLVGIRTLVSLPEVIARKLDKIAIDEGKTTNEKIIEAIESIFEK